MNNEEVALLSDAGITLFLLHFIFVGGSTISYARY
jgi:hypothetical protein